MVDENRIEGTVRNVGGKVGEAVGRLTGDASIEIRGKAQEAAGIAQNAYGQVVDEVKGFASDKPVVALLAAMGIGVVLGFALRRR